MILQDPISCVECYVRMQAVHVSDTWKLITELRWSRHTHREDMPPHILLCVLVALAFSGMNASCITKGIKQKHHQAFGSSYRHEGEEGLEKSQQNVCLVKFLFGS